MTWLHNLTHLSTSGGQGSDGEHAKPWGVSIS